MNAQDENRRRMSHFETAREHKLDSLIFDSPPNDDGNSNWNSHISLSPAIPPPPLPSRLIIQQQQQREKKFHH